MFLFIVFTTWNEISKSLSIQICVIKWIRYTLPFHLG